MRPGRCSNATTAVPTTTSGWSTPRTRPRFAGKVAGGALESARADWLLSHVYAVLGRSDEAVRYARRCLDTCEANRFGDFDLAYAFEGVARSAACVGDADEAARWRAKAVEAALAIADGEDRDLFRADLAAEPWYGT